VVVGSGAAGCATAYFLAKAGVSVTIVEREAVASSASGFAPGLLNPLRGAGIPGPLQPLAMASFRMHAALAEELAGEGGIDFQAETLPYLYLSFADAEVRALDQVVEISEAAGFPARWLDAREIAALEPRVSPRAVRAVRVEGLRRVDSYQYTLALLNAAERHGATLRHGAVDGLERANGRVTGVALAGQPLACDAVVIAMGPWSEAAARWLGVPVPVEPLKGQIVRLRLPGPPLTHYLAHEGSYVTSKADGLIWAGTTEERVGFRNDPTEDARDAITTAALQIVPALSDAELVLQTACLRPVTSDMLPIIGRVSGTDGAYLATGGGRKGILLSLAMGQAVADLITRGRTHLPISPFSPARFEVTGGRPQAPD
jgi:glycine/D-amino acid oxidase-like deaminating enzyme